MAVEGSQLITFEWAMVGITLILVILRIYAQSHRPIYPTSPSLTARVGLELFTCMAWLSFAAGTATDTLLIPLGGYVADSGNLAPGKKLRLKTVEAMKILYAENICYLNCMYAIKCHMLLFYRTVLITPSTSMRKTLLCLNLTTAFVLLAWPLEILLAALTCLPVSRNWSTDPKMFCSPFEKPVVYFFVYGPHLMSDLMVYLIPIPVLFRLHNITKRQKVFAAISFGVGFLCITFAAAQVACNAAQNVNITVNYVVAAMEQTWAILVVCVPALKVFLRGRRRQKSAGTIYSSRKGYGGKSLRSDSCNTAGGEAGSQESRSRSHEEEGIGVKCSKDVVAFV